jgi:hypothetical protein
MRVPVSRSRKRYKVLLPWPAGFAKRFAMQQSGVKCTGVLLGSVL